MYSEMKTTTSNVASASPARTRNVMSINVEKGAAATPGRATMNSKQDENDTSDKALQELTFSVEGGAGSIDGSLRREEETSTNVVPHPNQYFYVLPVLFLEFLSLAITRAALPSLIIHTFGDQVYFVMGCAECIRGLLAFISCPLFGKISDIIGRQRCFFVTVLGTVAPVCTLAILTLLASDDNAQISNDSAAGKVDSSTGGSVTSSTSNMMKEFEENVTGLTPTVEAPTQSHRVWIFVYLLALSGFFSSTFTLVFAYISDTVHKQSERVSAYGLALATFGLSYTIGPMAGGYLAHSETNAATDDNNQLTTATTLDGDTLYDEGYQQQQADSNNSTNEGSVDETMYPVIDTAGQKRVFTCSLVLAVLDLLYIYYILPESLPERNRKMTLSSGRRPSKRRLDAENFFKVYDDALDNDDEDCDDNLSRSSFSVLQERIEHWTSSVLPQQWTPLDALRVFSGDPLLAEVCRIAFLYYTGLWAVISTMMFYATKRFHYGPERLGELMSAFGLCTMMAEAVLLRIIVPMMGEKKTMRLGLIAFALQCAVLGLAYEGWQLFVCVAFSLASNLVYPSLTSFVSASVHREAVGEALGAINGVKALTEGIGPLVFGGLMTLSEKSPLPGWPYLIASGFALLAFHRASYLPGGNDFSSTDGDEDILSFGKKGLPYLSEKYHTKSKLRKQRTSESRIHAVVEWFFGGRGEHEGNSVGVQAILSGIHEDSAEELDSLLSEEDSSFENDDISDHKSNRS